MSITYKVTKFLKDADEDKKLVGLTCTDAAGNVFVVDKKIDLVDGTTDAQYVSQAYTASKTEIDEWSAEMSVHNMVFDPNNNTLSSGDQIRGTALENE